MRSRGALVAVAASVLASTAVVTASAQPDAATYDKPTIRYTEYGIPHIIASNYEGIGEGYGYAVATDNICALADIYLTVDAQRSRHHGPDGAAEAGYTRPTTNLNSDLFFQRLKDDRTVEKLIELPPPDGPDPEVRQTISGYVKGFNRLLAETGVDGITDPACAGADWVRPITELDVYRHAHASVLMGSIDYVLDGVVNAAPAVVPADSPAAQPPPDLAERTAELLTANHDKGIGSNALAVGSAGVADGKSMLLGNPHFPWYGKNRFYQAHLTIPGKLDVAGASLLGLPGVMFGHNADVAWSHTVATVAPFGLFDVQVDPLRPTSYLVDGTWEDMTSQQVSVDVRRADGTIGTERRTLWSTRYGPITTSLQGTIPLPWVVSAHAVREANMTNLRALNTWSRLARTGDANEVVDVLSETQGVPFLNTIAADRKGNALYADIQVAPNISDEHAEKCLTATGRLLFGGALTPTPLSILDGKRSACDWPDDQNAAAPGLLDPGKQPRLMRADYVGNANDSAWLANPEEPLSYPRVMGDTGTARTTRTQELIVTAQERLAGTDGLPGKGFSPGSMRELLFADHSRTAELVIDETVAMCEGFVGGLAPHNGGLIDVREACPVLAAWDQTYTLDSRGSLLFQKFWDNIGLINLGAGPIPAPWKDAFDPADPVHTPNQLATDRPDVWLAFGNAVAQLRAAGIPADAPLADHQAVTRGGERMPMHGSRHSLGVLNVVNPDWDPNQGGNFDVRWGSSFIQEVHFPAAGPPSTATLLTYAQSADPTSPHFADQTRLFSAGTWVTERFTEQEITASPALAVVVLD